MALSFLKLRIDKKRGNEYTISTSDEKERLCEM